MRHKIEENIKDYIEKKEESGFSSDTISLAREVDSALSRLEEKYDKLKNHLSKDYPLKVNIEKLVLEETNDIIKH